MRADTPGDEGVRHDHVVPLISGGGSHPIHGGPQNSRMGALGGPERSGRHRRLEVGDWVNGNVTDDDGDPDLVHRGPKMHTRPRQQTTAETEPGGTVVVAAGDHHLGTGVHQSQQGIGEQPHRVRRREGPVVDVACDEDRVDALRTDDVDQMVEEAALGTEQPGTVERPSQVPVGGVQQPHDRNARSRHRQRPGPKRGSRLSQAAVL